MWVKFIGWGSILCSDQEVFPWIILFSNEETNVLLNFDL